MFEPFPGNDVWNLSVNICREMGGVIGEIEQANAPVYEAAKLGDDAGTEAFFTAWMALADRLRAQGDAAAAAGNGLTASGKYARALAYYITAERMQAGARYMLFQNWLAERSRAAGLNRGFGEA